MLTSIIVKNPDNLLPALEALGRRILAFWDFAGQPLEIEYKPHVDRRSLSQNAQIHALFEDIATHFTNKGHPLTKEQAKELMKYKFLGTRDMVIGNTVIPNQLVKTSSLDKGEMSHFINEIINWALDHGVKIRNPHDGEYMQARRSSLE